MRLKWILICWLAALVPSGTALAYGIAGHVIGNGGNSAPPASSGPHKLYGTAGQAVVGQSSNASRIVCHGFWCFGGVRTIAVDPGAGVPSQLEFGAAVPNPTSRGVSFALALPKPAEVRLLIYDVRGRAVAEPVHERLDPGRYRLEWSRSGDVRQGAGVYFVRLVVNGQIQGDRRVVVLE